jgi:hypothetical protein
MPSDWEIWITSDRKNWRRLQTVTDAKQWAIGEARQFDVGPAPDVTGIKLVISATRKLVTLGIPIDTCMRLYEFRPIFEVTPD